MTHTFDSGGFFTFFLLWPTVRHLIDSQKSIGAKFLDPQNLWVPGNNSEQVAQEKTSFFLKPYRPLPIFPTHNPYRKWYQAVPLYTHSLPFNVF